jgi:hypothetical protein
MRTVCTDSYLARRKEDSVKKTILTFLTAVSFLSATLWANAQTSSEKQRIPSGASPELRKELEKLLSSELTQRLEGAYNIGNMREKAALSIPILMEVLKGYDGMVEVDEPSLKYFEKGTAFMVYQGKANTINPVHIVVTDALGKIGKPAIEPLRAALPQANPKELFFSYAADALAKTQDPEAAKILLSILSTGDATARFRIAESLRYSKDPASVDALIQALKDKDKEVKSAAARSLNKITGQAFGEDANKWEEWRAKNKPNQ